MLFPMAQEEESVRTKQRTIWNNNSLAELVFLADDFVARSENVLLGLVGAAGAVQHADDVLARDVLLALRADLRVVRLQLAQQHLLVRRHARSREHGRVVGHPGEEHEALAHGGAGARLVVGDHLEDAVQHLVVVQLVHHLLEAVAAISEHRQRLVLRQLAQDPVHRGVLLLEVLPQVLEVRRALLHLVLVAREVDVLRRDVEDVLVARVAARRTVQLLDDDLLRHLLERVHLQVDMGSLPLITLQRSYGEELAHHRRDGAHLRALDDGRLQTYPRDEHELGASAGHSGLVLHADYLNQGKLALSMILILYILPSWGRDA